MNKKILSILALGAISAGSVFGVQNEYGLPENIQEGNILHCFNWSMNDVRANLQNIAEAGFGSVQLSPLQRRNVEPTHVWSDVYRPYDFAFQESTALGTAEDLRALCSEAESYGIKVLVDVVANHVDKAAGYHDPWWNGEGYVRSWGGNANINYGNRYSITHDRLGDYGEVNSENPEVIARAVDYVSWLHENGVSGIRWDAAKHIALPSEGCDFWSAVTSVPGMYHYGEILGVPGPSNHEELIKEYAKYMCVTDSRYSDESAESNGGIPLKRNGEWAEMVGLDKLVYWGETHDTYSNTPDFGGWSSSMSQETIDRAYAAVACREGATALYLARPRTSGYSNIKVVKGTDHYRTPAIREVNKFRNKMNGRSEYFSVSADGNAVSVTRNNGGAVIVRKGSGQFAVDNGGSLCPAGTYTDRVSGNTITVTDLEITGTTGPTGIVVIYYDDLEDADPNAPVQGFDDNTITVYYDNSETAWPRVYCHYWGGASSSNWPGKIMSKVEGDKYGRDIYSITLPAGSSGLFGKGSSGPQTADSPGPLKANHIYKGLSSTTGGKHDLADMGIYGDAILIYFDNTETQYTDVCCHYWGGSSSSSFPGVAMSKVEGDVYSVFIPASTTGILFAQKDAAQQTVDVTNVKDGYIYRGLAEKSGSKNKVAAGEPYNSVTSITDTKDFRLAVGNGEIIVDGLDNDYVSVSGIDGRTYAAGHYDGRVAVGVTPGIYIINVSGTVRKVVVR